MNFSLNYFVIFHFSIKGSKCNTVATDPFAIPVLNRFEVEMGFYFNKNRIAISYLKGDLTPLYSQA